MDLTIDVDGMVDFLVQLLNIPSPTGDTGRAMAFLAEALAPLPPTFHLTPKGVLVGTWSGREADQPRALTAHVDTLGAMVAAVKRNGRLKLTKIGNYIWQSVEGEGVTVFTEGGERWRGTILPTSASGHAHKFEEKTAARTEDNMEVRLDARTSSRKETKALGINVGDFIAFDPRVETGPAGFIRSRHLDDKASVAAIFGALQALAAAGLTPSQTTTIHLSNYEEVGHGAAAGFPPDIHDLLAVDMAVVAPGQQSREEAVTICAKDSGGPYHLDLRRELTVLAEAGGLDFVVDVYPYYGSDGTAYWRSGGDVRVGLIGPGVDASHHYERAHRDGLEQTARLIAAYLLS